MFRKLFMAETAQKNAPKEGDLYKNITAFGRTFELRYGYYEAFERQHNDPMPIYPDFLREPVFTDNGEPFVTQMQDACQYYNGSEETDRECAGCGHYIQGEEFLGICGCPHNKKQIP